MDSSNSVITELTIPSSVESIGSYAFEGCTSLTKITFEGTSRLTTIGGWTFRSCSNLVSINGNLGNVTSLGSGVFQHDAKLVGSETDEKLSFPNVTVVPASAFYGCSALKSVSFSKNLTEIASSAFEKATKLTSFSFEDSLINIAARAFCDSGLSCSVKLGKNRGNIHSFCFARTKITSLDLSDCVKMPFVDDNVCLACTKLTSVSLPPNANKIWGGAFEECTSLTSFDFKGIQLIVGSRVFYNCLSLTNITGVENITEIYSYAFTNCSNLSSITTSIPGEKMKKLTNVMDHAFSGCAALTLSGLSCFDWNKLTLGDYIFNKCSSLVNSEENPLVLTDCTISSLTFSGCPTLYVSLKKTTY